MAKFAHSLVYSVIKEEYSGRNISEAFLYLVKVVIKIQRYRSFSVQNICNDFELICGFRIPYHPMTVILNQLKSQGFIHDGRMGGYTSVQNRFDTEVSTDVLHKEHQLLDKLIQSFVSFANSNNPMKTITNEEAERIIDYFVEFNGTNLIRSAPEHSMISDDSYLRLFYSFFGQLKESDPDTVEYIGSLIVGRLLAELYINGHNDSSNNSRSNATVYLDTSVVFSLLGIDAIDRRNVYKELIDSTINLGMSVRVFYHTFSEMITLIEGSKYWIGNPEYDPMEATAATRYFVNNNFSQKEVDDFVFTLESQLNDHGIYIDNMDYPLNAPRGVLTEQEYYDLIVAKYREHSSAFDEEAKRQTIDKDARSLFFVDYLNAGMRAHRIQDITSIFVTTNTSLASVSKSRTIIGGSEIPDCVNDVFWGTIIWLNNPQKLLSNAKSRVSANVFAAFLPSTALIRKLTESVDQLEQEELITPEEAYFLKSSTMAQDILREITHNDEKCFSEKTTVDILDKIRQDAIIQGKTEERQIANGQIDKLNRTMAEMRKSFERQTETQGRQLLDTRIRLLQSEIKSEQREISVIERELNNQTAAKTDALCRYRESKNIIGIILIIFSICLIVAAVFLFEYGRENNVDYINIISAIFSIIAIGSPAIFFVFSEMPLDSKTIYTRILRDKFTSACKKAGYNESLVTIKQAELAEHNAKLVVLQDQLKDLRAQEVVTVSIR